MGNWDCLKSGSINGYIILAPITLIAAALIVVRA
jgi:hypothetical protein